MNDRGFEAVSGAEGALLPLRSSKTSAGYDFYATEDIVIPPQGKAEFATGVKAYMRPEEMLLLVVRSSAGRRLDLMIANTVGVVDSDFYNNPSDEGNIRICLRNLRPAMELEGYTEISGVSVPVIKDLRAENTVYIKAGDRVAQGIFLPVLESDNGGSESGRSGGLGSSGR